MIPANEQVDIFDHGKKEYVAGTLEPEEQAQVYAFDAEIEVAAKQRRAGEMFVVTVLKEDYPSVVINSVKNLWEAGGWVVGVFESEEARQIVFARPPRTQPSAVAQAFEVRRQAQEITFDSPTETSTRMPRTSRGLLVRMPTRARPAQAFEVLSKWRSMASEHVSIEVVIDADDMSMNNSQILSRLSDLDCFVTVGHHKNKIDACNGGRLDDWQVLVLASDDMMPVVQGYDFKILEAFEKHFPLFDGALCFPDGYNKEHVKEGEPVTCTLPIIGRALYEDYGRVVYHPGYKSIFCDTDQTFLFTKMKRMVFVDEMIVEHRHYAAGKAQFDKLYQENDRHNVADEKLFEERRKRGFDAPHLTLSILICSTHERRRQLEKLVDYLRWQIRLFPRNVEICVDCDENSTVGEKRQRLLERACGKYVAFVDDDDMVANDYVERLLKAAGEDPDCASLVGVYTVNGENPRRFEHSLAYETWEDRGDLLVRTPNHLNLVRRDLALEVGFVSQNVGEDHVFSDAIKPFLHVQAFTGNEPLYFYWSRPEHSVQQ